MQTIHKKGEKWVRNSNFSAHETPYLVFQSTPLHNACQAGHIEIVTYLLGKGTNINVQNDYGVKFLELNLDNEKNLCKVFYVLHNMRIHR